MMISDDRVTLYSSILRQLDADGYEDVANRLRDCMNVNEDSHKSTDLLELVRKYGTWINLDKMLLGGERSKDGRTAIARNITPKSHQRWAAAHRAVCSTVAAMSDGQICASGGEDNTVRVMTERRNKDANNKMGYRIWTRVFLDHWAPITSLAFHPTLPILFSGSEDRTIKVYDVSQQSPGKAEGESRSIQDIVAPCCLCVHPCGSFLFVGSKQQIIRLYDLNTLNSYATSKLHDSHRGGVTDIACGDNGSLFASASVDGSIKIWDGVSNHVINTIENAHGGCAVESVKWCKEMSYLLSSGLDGVARLWDMRRGCQVISMGNATQVTYMKASFMKDENFIVTANSEAYNAGLVFYNSMNGEMISTVSYYPRFRIVNMQTLSKEMGIIVACSDNRCRLLEISFDGGRGSSIEGEELHIDL